MRKLLLSGAAVAAMSIAAGNPAHAVPPAYSWTGCYIGGNVGGAWARKQFTAASFITSGQGIAGFSDIAGGGQIGCDIQSGMWVFGVQGMFDWTSLEGQDPFFLGKAISTRTPWFATAAGRVGYAPQPGFLIFLKGGAAWARDEHKLLETPTFVNASANVTRTGWLIGGGFEWMLIGNWSVGVEYGRMEFGTENVLFQGHGGFPNFTDRVSQRVQFALVSFNYRFGSGR
jgi:outer membrane immunogenic protein